MINDVMTVTDKCRKCGKEFELGEKGDKQNGIIVCLKCASKKKTIEKKKHITSDIIDTPKKKKKSYKADKY